MLKKIKIDNRAVIMGDLNTVSREENAKAPLKYSNYIHILQQLGWIDAWKKRHLTTTDYTWYSTKQNGFRLDYIFLSRKIVNLLNSSNLSQQERLNNYSDHALVVAELLV
ncbi:endonuclease/exonuclease/phosphatase family protein [Virgibacillus sp. L01]|uniref:endonuclease/exonuclease/phosphatase family protein n=1 Tax=Virgibacillus sp. L01 TaxID=3457429 RepID=UPI003FD36A20